MRVLMAVVASSVLFGQIAMCDAAQPSECAQLTNTIGAIRDRIDAMRKALSADEADCAFEEFTTNGLSRYCMQVKRAANAAAQRTWNDIQYAWDALNRTRLQLRQAEDRLGIECPPQSN
jgi:hypothetical protein